VTRAPGRSDMSVEIMAYRELGADERADATVAA
jgi:hypothetical protein